MDKVLASPGAAVADIGDGASIGIAGFGVAHRFPSSLIIALRDKGSAGLTVYCNGLGQPGFPTAHLLADSHQISRLVTCFSARPGVTSEAERQIRAGQMSLELVPQGPLVERMRAGGAGLPAFYTLTREQIGRRVAALLPDDAVVNLGAGLPGLVANYLRGRSVILHSENGMLNYGELVYGASFDPDLHDASGHFVTVRDGASFFDSVTSFEIARSGRLDAVVLGAYQVGANGDLANWSVPGMTGGGIGGAMDLAVGARQVIAMCEHTDSAGQPKLVGACDFEVTAPGCVDMAVTDLALLRRTDGRFRLAEIARGFTADEVVALTRMNLDVAGPVAIMQESWGD